MEAHPPHGRVADGVDDQGVPFALQAGGGGRGGQALVAVEFRVPDAGRCRAFYSTVLGWRFRPDPQPDRWRAEIDGTAVRPTIALVGGHPTAVVVPTIAVADLDTAVAAVRAAGGRDADPSADDGARTAECEDDQGAPFLLAER